MIIPKLPYSLQKRQAFNIADCTANFYNNYINIILSDFKNRVLYFIRYMRNYLNR